MLEPELKELTKRCSRCGEIKNLDDFYLSSKSSDRHGSWCKSCSNKHRKALREVHPRRPKVMKAIYDAGKGQVVKECSHCHEIKLLDDFYRYGRSLDQHFVWCKTCSNKASQERRKNQHDKVVRVAHERYLRLRDKILLYSHDRNLERKALLVAHYSKNISRCICCGEANVHFLTIDHIEQNGSQHRKSSKCGTGSTFYRWLIKEGMPEGYQVLCYNCNLSRTWHGKCIHRAG